MKTHRVGAVICTLLVAMFYFQLSALAVVNSLIVKEEDGVATANYPMQIGRPFMPGEIPNYPQVRVNGVSVTTQADVKQRYPDGSVKHSILTFLIPNLPANGSVTITFRDQTTGNNSPFLTGADMLQSNFDFELKMDLADTNNTQTASASARTMIQNSAFTYWMKGIVATSVIIADHSAARAYDLGFDSFKPFRPIFHATFFPGINKVRIRAIGEIANTEAMEDMAYNLTLNAGNASPVQVYSKAKLKHHGGSRWTKEFWIGGAPSKISVNHNLAYLSETKAFSNYDTTITLPVADIVYRYNYWTGSVSKDINEVGQWTKYMPTTGGRDEIAPYPAWTVDWLFTGDWRMKEIAFTQADLAAAWPIHLREGDVTKNVFDSTQMSVSPMGRPISVVARPTIWTWRDKWNWNYTDPADQIIPVGPMVADAYTPDAHGWVIDGAHQPDPFYAQYMLTGDYWYFEELVFWSAWNAGGAPSGDSQYYCRGPLGHGGYFDQPRGEAWAMRNRARTAYAAPDTCPEKKYFTNLLNDMIACFEGRMNITGTAFQNTLMWNWANTIGQGLWEGKGVPTMPFWQIGSSVAGQQAPMDPSVVLYADAPWQFHYLTYALGNVTELGFPADSLLSWLSRMVIGELTTPGYNPYNCVSYRIPIVKKDGTYFTSFAQAQTGFLSTYNAQADFNSTINFDAHLAYSSQVLAAAAMSKCFSGGPAAWNWAYSNIRVPANAKFQSRPGWAFLPRDCMSVTGVSDQPLEAKSLTSYPNPTTDEITFAGIADGTNMILIYNAVGQLVQSNKSETKEGRITLSVSNLAPGIYSAALAGENNFGSIKFTIQR